VSTQLQLLMVEDQRFDAMLLRKLLETPLIDAGRIDHAESLSAAIDLLERHFYDAVLLDLGLPDSDGVDAVRRLCAQFPAVAIVVLTGRDEEQVGVDAMEAGAQDKLGKSGLDAAQLAHSLRYAVARQRQDEDLRQSAEAHRVLFENNPFALLVYEVNTLRFLAVNEAASRQYGYTREEFLSRSLPDVWPPDEAERALISVKALSGANLKNEEWHHRRKDGSTFDVEINAQPINFRGRRARIVMARDITLRNRAISALETSEKRFRKLFQYSLGLICTHDLAGIILSVNPAVARTLGYEVSELMGRKLSDFCPPALSQAFEEYLQRIARNKEDSGLLYLVARDGQPRIWEYHNVIDEDEGEPYVLGHAQDITDRRRYERQLKEQSIRDPLTGCYNRRFLEQHVASMSAAACWGCIVIDLDHFKQINDTQGHQRGDEVLVGMGRFLTLHAANEDIVVRMGGDEFLVLVGKPGEDGTAELASRLAAASDQAPSGFTIGWAVRESDENVESTIRRADRALYASRVAARS